MATVEGGVERFGFFHTLSSFFKNREFVAEKHRPLPINAENIFASPYYTNLTIFGQDINGILTARNVLLNQEMPQERKKELTSQINAKCKKLNMDKGQLNAIDNQFRALVEIRSSEMDNYRPTVPSPK